MENRGLPESAPHERSGTVFGGDRTGIAVRVWWDGWFVVWYGILGYGMVWYGMVWHGMVWYGVLCCAVLWCGILWYGIIA